MTAVNFGKYRFNSLYAHTETTDTNVTEKKYVNNIQISFVGKIYYSPILTNAIGNP